MKKEHTKNVAFFGYYPITQRFLKLLTIGIQLISKSLAKVIC